MDIYVVLSEVRRQMAAFENAIGYTEQDTVEVPIFCKLSAVQPF